jgi:hypothetical protein
MRCIGHIINLAVQAFLFQDLVEMEELASYDENERNTEGEPAELHTIRGIGPLGKLHNIVVHIRGSPGRTKQFKSFAKRLIPLDNRTRWNSWYSMVQVALNHESAIDAYTKANYESLAFDFLDPDEWKCLHMICSFLQPFHEATLKTQSDRATVDRLLFTMEILIEHFQQAVSYFCWIQISNTDKYYSFGTTKMIENSAFAFRTAGILLISITVKRICRLFTPRRLYSIRVAEKLISSVTGG